MDELTTERLLLRPWAPADAESALGIYGAAAVTRWLTPAMGHIDDVATMRDLLTGWTAERSGPPAPEGRWAVARRDTGTVVGGLSLHPLPPDEEDLEIGWQLAPDAWGQGYASEAATGLVRWAFTQDIDEVFAVARPNNHRAIATAKRIGMQWVGETDKYYNLRLQVYRIRPADLDR